MAYTKTWLEYHRFRNFGHYSVNGANTLNSAATYTVRSWNNTKSGERQPDYKQKIRDGNQAATPFSCDQAKLLTEVPGYMEYSIQNSATGQVNSEYWDGFVFNMNPYIAHLSASTTKSDAVALSKVLQKIQDEYQQMNSPAFLAEFHQTLQQFGAPCEAIIDLTNRTLNKLALERKGLKGSTVFKRIKWDGIIAKTWLEYSFGLMPLISDTKAAAEALARFNVESDPEITSKFRSRVMSRGEDEVSTSVAIAPVQLEVCTWNYSRYLITKTLARTQYVVGLHAPPVAAFGSNERLLQLLGLDPKNIVPAIWEAIPWSWLVDYFTNVQEILAAGATNTASVAWIVKTVTQQTTQTQTTRLVRPSVPTGWFVTSSKSSDHAGLLKGVRTTVSRTLPASLGVPPVYFEHPFESYPKIANLIAVLFSRRGGNSALVID